MINAEKKLEVVYWCNGIRVTEIQGGPYVCVICKKQTKQAWRQIYSDDSAKTWKQFEACSFQHIRSHLFYLDHCAKQKRIDAKKLDCDTDELYET